MLVVEGLVNRMDEFTEVTKHTIGSVLSAVAIEANVIPYNELESINLFFRKNDFQSSSFRVLITFLVNLVHYQDFYTKTLRAVGILEAVIEILKAQTQEQHPIGSTIRINVGYPTSTMKLGFSSAITGEQIPVDKNNLLLYLASHCRQNINEQKDNGSVCIFREREFSLLMEFLTLVATKVSNGELAGFHEEEQDYFVRIFCDVGVLECICLLLTDENHQKQGALMLWYVILEVAFLSKKQNTSIYNMMNCILQSVRYISLAIYYQGEDSFASSFNPTVSALHGVIGCLEELFKPISTNSSRCDLLTLGLPEDQIFRLNNTLSKINRDRAFIAFVDSGAVYTLLGVLVTVVRDRGVESNEVNVRGLAVVGMVLRLFHIVIVENAAVCDAFNG
jgi:hypothetical protein